jgi:hypothetical protein
VDEQGALSWLQRVDSIGVNGVHAVVVAPVLVRVEMLRFEHTYDLLIIRTALWLRNATNGHDWRVRFCSLHEKAAWRWSSGAERGLSQRSFSRLLQPKREALPIPSEAF